MSNSKTEKKQLNAKGKYAKNNNNFYPEFHKYEEIGLSFSQS